MQNTLFGNIQNKYMKILLLKFRNIGDVLLTSPIISNLKSFYPDAKIDFCVNRGTEAMLSLNPNLNKVITYEREKVKSLTIAKRLWSEYCFISSFKKENYDIVINLTNGDRGNFILWFSNAPIRIGYSNKKWFSRKNITHSLPDQGLRHTIETNLDPLRVLNIPVTDKKVEIFWSENDQQIINEELIELDYFVHIHPVSRWLFKCMDDNTMSQIIDFCELDLGIKVVITAADNDLEIQKVNRIVALAKSDPVNLSGALTLKQTAALNKKAKLFIGVDTAIMHISAANNIPVLAFFGPSGACHWGPWDNSLMESGYTKVSGMQVMGMHRVFSETRACQPCGKDGCNGTKFSVCLMSLNFKQIETSIKEMINE